MNHKPMPIRMLLVEDDLDVAAGIGAYLECHQVRVEFACTARSARALLREGTFDLVVLDVQLPDQDGLSLCRELKRAGLASPILFLTARSGLKDKLQGFEAGAVDYLVKPFAPAELLARARALVAHIPATGGIRLRAGSYSLDFNSRLLVRGNCGLPLHHSGFCIVRRLMEANPGSVSRDELCDVLWSGATPESDPLRMHIHDLRRALHRCFGFPLIQTVRGVGYRFKGDDEAA